MKIKIEKKLFTSTASLPIILVLVLSLIPAATLVNADTNENQFSVKVDFEEPTYASVRVQGNCYDMVQLGDCSYLSEVGKPMLPVKGALILLPPKMDVESVNVAAEFEALPGQFNVCPTQPPANNHNSPNFAKPDRTAYASAAPYPNKWYEQETVLSFRGYQLLYLRLYPVQYTGANRRIKFCREMDITVTVTPTKFMTERFKCHENGLGNSPAEMDEWISQYVLNPEMMMQYKAALSPGSEPSPPPVVDYLIVTREMFLDVLTTYPTSTTNGSSLFIRSKKFAGLQVAVETLEDIRNQYTGYDDADEIRQCIQHYYTTYGITFVLLLGDVENSTADWYVPVRNMYNPDGESTWTPSDFYYAGLDGTWDADGDHIYGEREALSTQDEADWGPDVYVGRITAKTASELETQLNKIANFKGFSDSSITNMVMCGAIMDTDEKPLKEYVRDNFVPSSVTVSELYESVGTLTESNFTEVVNSKRPEVINTASHGWYTSLSPGYFTTTTTPDLMKGPLYLWYACACLAGAFDYSSDCVGEAMMKDPDGGGMFIGASRETWLYTAYPAHLNGLWGKQDWLFWQHFFEYKMYDPGSSLYNSKAAYISGGPDLEWEIERKNLFAMNLLGDPQARARCAKRAKILFDESHDGDWLIEQGGLHYDLAMALRSVGYTVDSLQVHYGPSATIDFDDLSSGNTIERHYLGLNFSSGFTAWDSTGNLYYPPHSTPNVAYTYEPSNYIIFDVPVQSVGAYFCSPDNYNITWLAYDRADNLLDSASIPADAVNVYRSLFDQQGRIRKLVTTGTVSGWNSRWSMDDLNYTSNVYIQTISDYDTLVLPPGEYQGSYSSLEVNYTKSFVTSGGGLCIIGEHKNWMVASNLNLISSHYGVTFQENVFNDPTHYDVHTFNALVHTFPAAGDSTYGILVKGLTTVLYPSGCSLSVSSPATAVATGDGDSYTTGSYESLMAAATSGDGRVFCVGDANIWDKQDFPGNGVMHLYQQDNLYLMYNVFDWLTGTRATRSVSILIDQAHGSYYSVYYGDISSYSGLCDYLRHDNYGVYILQTSPITYSTLADYDIFVLPLPALSFSTSEIDSIKQFVYEGGHLWIIGDCGGYGTYPNQVSSEFDIEFDENYVADPTDYQEDTYWVFYYSRNFVHQITNCLTKLESYAGASLTLSGLASSAITTDSDASPVSSSVMAVNTYGDGRVVVMGDSSYFCNLDAEIDGISCIDEADNAKLALRIVSWAPCLETYEFPSATSTMSLAYSPYVWVSGDYAEEEFAWSHSLPAIQIIIHFEVTSTLSEDGYIPMDVLIDGTKVGEFIIMRGHDCIDKTFSLMSNPINQGNFTTKYLVTRTVDAGKGSVEMNTTSSYIRLVRTETPGAAENLYLVVRGLTDSIYYRNWSSSVWGDWTALPGATTDSPAAAVLGNDLHIVVKGLSGEIWHGYVNLTTSVWSGWTMVPGATPSTPTLAASASKLYLVVRGMDDGIYYNSWTAATDWEGWTGLTGATTDQCAAAVLSDNLHIVVKGLAGQIWHGYVDLSTSVWSGWSLVSGGTPSTPELAASATKLYLVVRGLNDGIYYRSWSSGVWGGWTVLSGATTDSPAATVLDDNLHIVVKGSTGEIWHGYVNLGTSVWSGWSLVSGATPSTPELAA